MDYDVIALVIIAAIGVIAVLRDPTMAARIVAAIVKLRRRRKWHRTPRQ